MNLLKNKNIVIIGGTAGIGLSAALAFVAMDANVVVVGRNADVISADATNADTAVNAINTCIKRFGNFDGLYHVAGGSGRKMGDGPLHEISDEGWHFTLDLNLNSLFYSNRAAVQQFLKQGTGGSILNMGSVLGFSPSPRFFSTHAYAATKAAIIGLTKSAASFYASKNIRFNVLAPALVETPMSG